MFAKREVVSVFDVEDGLVKLVQVSVEDQKKSLALLAAQRYEAKDGSAVKAIKKLAASGKIAGTRILLNFPRHNLTVKNLKLPSSDPEEIANMVALQAAKHLPFLPEKIVFGYRVLGLDKKGYSDIMMALAHRDIIDKTYNLFSGAGIEAERMVLSSEALGLFYLERQKEPEKRLSVCLIDIGRTVMEIQIVNDGKISFTRSVRFHAPGGGTERMADEIKNSIYTYNKNFPGPEVSRLVLTGKRSLINREAPALKKAMGLPAVYIDILKAHAVKKEAIHLKDKELSEETFTAAISIGFNANKLQTDLMAGDIRLKKKVAIFTEGIIMSAALFLSIAVGVSAIGVKHFIDKKRYLSSIEKQLKETAPEVKKLARLKNASELVKKQIELEGSSVDILRELYDNIPPSITLTIFDYKDGSWCLLRGISKSYSDVFKFNTTLEKSPYFENVKVRYATKRKIRGEDLADFEIICQLTPKGKR